MNKGVLAHYLLLKFLETFFKQMKGRPANGHRGGNAYCPPGHLRIPWTPWKNADCRKHPEQGGGKQEAWHDTVAGIPLNRARHFHFCRPAWPVYDGASSAPLVIAFLLIKNALDVTSRPSVLETTVHFCQDPRILLHQKAQPPPA